MADSCARTAPALLIRQAVRVAMPNRVSVLVVVLLAGLAACGGSDVTGRAVGALREVGGPAPGINHGIRGTIRIAGGAGQTQEVSTSSTGAFEVELSAGAYLVTGRSPEINDGKSDCRAASKVVVKRDRTVRVDVICDIF